MSRDSGRRLTPEEREQIITLRLQGVSVRAVSAQVDTSTKSVVAVTKTFLAERAAAFSAKTDATLNKLVTRHLAAADAAAVAAERALELDDHATAAKYLAEVGGVAANSPHDTVLPASEIVNGRCRLIPALD